MSISVGLTLSTVVVIAVMAGNASFAVVTLLVIVALMLLSAVAGIALAIVDARSRSSRQPPRS